MDQMRKLIITMLATLGVIIMTNAVVAEVVSSRNDVELQGLFTQLAEVQTPNEAKQLTQKIWNRWLAASGNPADELMMRRGILHMRSGQLQDAENMFSTLITLNPDYTEAWNKRATVRFLQDNLIGSERDIFEVLRREPKHFGALSGLGQIKLRHEDLLEALTIYERLLSINPFNSNARRAVSVLQKKLKGRVI